MRIRTEGFITYVHLDDGLKLSLIERVFMWGDGEVHWLEIQAVGPETIVIQPRAANSVYVGKEKR